MLDIDTGPDSGERGVDLPNDERIADHFGGDGVEFIFDETVDYTKMRGQANERRWQANEKRGQANDLAKYRFWGTISTSGEVADSLRAAKGPEPGASAAKASLAKTFHRLVLKEASKHSGDYGDLVAAGMMGLAEAIDRFDTRRNTGLAAFAIPYIRGRIQVEAKAFNHNGWAGETRLQRLIYGNHDATPEQASRVMGRPVDEVELAQARTEVLGMISDVLEYDTREVGYEDDERKPGIIVQAPLNGAQRALDAALVRRHGSLRDLEDYADRRAKRRLKEVGRRAYALELVARDIPRADPHRFTPPLKYRVHPNYRYKSAAIAA